jgi:hypothetical protein
MGSSSYDHCFVISNTDSNITFGLMQTSLMYKLHQIYARRSKYRLTIFPGSVDHSLIASLIVIFLYGQ